MKKRLLLLTAVLPLTFGLVVYAQDKKDETELGNKMDKMSSAFRPLRKQISDSSKNADSLAKVAVIKEQALASLKLEPVRKAEIPAAQQAKFVADYQAKMKEFVALTEKLEAALKANNNEEAQKLVGQLADAQKAGHNDFKKEKKKS